MCLLNCCKKIQKDNTLIGMAKQCELMYANFNDCTFFILYVKSTFSNITVKPKYVYTYTCKQNKLYNDIVICTGSK